MGQEDKQLLLVDLCARLSYYPIVSVAYNYSDKGIVWEFDILRIKLLLEIEENDSWEYIKPYLRPMSSMTEEEWDDCHKVGEMPHNIIDWFNKRHFDYRHLIEKGLAIRAPEGMYKEEQQ